MIFTRRVLVMLMVLYLVLCEESAALKDDQDSVVCPPSESRPALAIDIKFVLRAFYGKRKYLVSRVTIVDEGLTVLYDTFVTSDMHRIRNINDNVKAVDYHGLREAVGNLTRCKILIGHKVSEWLKMLKIRHPAYLKRDTVYICKSTLGTDCKSLESLTGEFSQGELEHNTTKNAVTAMKHYKTYREQWEEYLKRPIAALALSHDVALSKQAGKLKWDGRGLRVSVVDELGSVMYDKIITSDIPLIKSESIFNDFYRENLTYADNSTAEEEMLRSLLKGKIVVAHGIRKEYGFIRINHPDPLCRDTKTYFPFTKVFPCKPLPSLRDLAEQLLNITMQKNHVDPVENARVLMQVYLKHREGLDGDAIRLI